MSEGGTLADYQRELLAIIGRPTEEISLLDLCCGECSHLKGLAFRESLHVDVNDWPNRPNDRPFLHCDVRAIEKTRAARGERWDVVLCSDGIEHLDKRSAYRLIAQMERYGRLAIVFCPYGIPESAAPSLRSDPFSMEPDQHKSEWIPEHFRWLEWSVKEFPSWHGNFGAFFAWRTNL